MVGKFTIFLFHFINIIINYEKVLVKFIHICKFVLTT